MNTVDAIRNSLGSKVTNDFNIQLALRSVLEEISMVPEDCGGSIIFQGRDPIVPSVFRLASAAGIGLVAKSVAAAKLWQMRGGKGQNISLDLRKAPHRLCPFYDRKWELVNGLPPTYLDADNPFDTSLYQTKDGRFVMPFNPYPGLKAAAAKLFCCGNDRTALKNAIGQWTGKDLELAGAEAGIVLPLVRTIEEFILEEQCFEFLAKQPLVEIVKIGESAPEPFPSPAIQPLSGVRVLALGRVIAGSGAGRALALHGADVLNIWQPGSMEINVGYFSANVGLRSATLDIHAQDGNRKLKSLLKNADVFLANRRPGYVESIGFSPDEAANLRPGIIHATISLHGRSGPWSNRVGFDQSAGSVSGVMTLEGTAEEPKIPVIGVVNDYIVAWLTAAGIMAALTKRAIHGGSYRVHVSLTRVSLWLFTLGLLDKQYAHEMAGSGGDHLYIDPDVFTANTECGYYQGVTDQVHMSETPGHYSTVLVPRGSGRSEWLPR